MPKRRTALIAVVAMSLVAAACSSSDDASIPTEFLLDPDDPNNSEYEITVPDDALPVVGVYSLVRDAFADEIDDALASVDDPVEEEFFACDPVVAWIEPSDDGYRFEFEEGWVDCATAVPYLAIYELPA